MNDLSIVTEKIQSLNQELADFGRMISERETEIIKNELIEGKVLGSEDTLRSNSYSFTILRSKPSANYPSDICQIYMKGDYNFDLGMERIIDLEMGYYTTTADSEFELNRIITLGRVAEVILNRSKDIVSSLNSVRDEYKERFKEINEELKTLHTQRRVLENQLAIENSKKFTKDLMVGVCFTPEVGFGKVKKAMRRSYYEFSDIKTLKVLELTKSGKTAKIEYTNKYNPEHKFYHSVKFEHIQGLYRHNYEVINENTFVSESI
jgi:hypothetical protein